ncbi:hypothetical protein FHS15_004644 [Paenibacillus castaneae]|uniref:hypothetical protein n=1 Tax=Paenibacillus castaneae TaxID=474957 RepID=UPI000C99EBE6|nr:hypothetical protein [Paenibacillus castaneae]NIK79484.1 hypothetical protein [Paenibacillus castaneae]
MLKARAITAGAIALTLAIGGGGLWASQIVNAAAANSGDKQIEQGKSDNSGVKMDRSWKQDGFGRGFDRIEDQLLAYLGIEKAALQTKLETLTLAEAAAEQGKTRAELKAKLVEWLEAAEAEAPAKTDVDAKANVDKQTDTGELRAKPDTSTVAEKLLDSQGFGHGGHRGGKPFGEGGNLAAVAAVMGLTADELKGEVEAGKTIAAIAKDKGIDVQKVIDARVSERKKKLDEELAAGTITQEQYNTKLAEAATHATEFVNNVQQPCGPDGQGRKGPRGERPNSTASNNQTAAGAEATA